MYLTRPIKPTPMSFTMPTTIPLLLRDLAIQLHPFSFLSRRWLLIIGLSFFRCGMDMRVGNGIFTLLWRNRILALEEVIPVEVEMHFILVIQYSLPVGKL